MKKSFFLNYDTLIINIYNAIMYVNIKCLFSKVAHILFYGYFTSYEINILTIENENKIEARGELSKLPKRTWPVNGRILSIRLSGFFVCRIDTPNTVFIFVYFDSSALNDLPVHLPSQHLTIKNKTTSCQLLPQHIA